MARAQVRADRKPRRGQHRVRATHDATGRSTDRFIAVGHATRGRALLLAASVGVGLMALLGARARG